MGRLTRQYIFQHNQHLDPYYHHKYLRNCRTHPVRVVHVVIVQVTVQIQVELVSVTVRIPVVRREQPEVIARTQNNRVISFLWQVTPRLATSPFAKSLYFLQKVSLLTTSPALARGSLRELRHLRSGRTLTQVRAEVG